MIYFGIDPGKSGGIGATWDDGKPYVSCCRFDGTEHDVADWLKSFDLSQAVAVLEQVNAMPKQGVTSSFNFGSQFGFCRGILTGLSIPFKLVRPLKWQTFLGCRTGGDKNVTKAEAQRRWPTLKITHRNADCLLLAEYARVEAWKDYHPSGVNWEQAMGVRT